MTGRPNQWIVRTAVTLLVTAAASPATAAWPWAEEEGNRNVQGRLHPLEGRHHLQAGMVGRVNDAFGSGSYLTAEYRYGITELLSVGVGWLHQTSDDTTRAYDLVDRPINLLQVRTTTPWAGHVVGRLSPGYGKLGLGDSLALHYGFHVDLGGGVTQSHVSARGELLAKRLGPAGWAETGLHLFVQDGLSLDVVTAAHVWLADFSDLEVDGEPLEGGGVKSAIVAGVRLGVLLPWGPR